MTPEDMKLIEALGLEWPPPERIIDALVSVLPADLDRRIAATEDDET